MRTLRTKVYTFNELSKEAQETAIEQIRNRYYEDNDFDNWAIDNCALFEPLQKELDLIGFDSSKGFLIENTRKAIYFDTDRNNFLECSNAMVITDNNLFLKWLGLSDEIINGEDFSFDIFTPDFRNADTTIQFDGYNSDFDNDIEKATSKFNNHIKEVLKRIEADIEYRFTDEAIKDDIEEDEFLSNGTLYS